MKLKRLLSVFLTLVMVFALLPAVSPPARAAEGGVEINAANFPDSTFRTYVSTNCDADGNGSLSATEIAAVTGIYANCIDLHDLTGVEYFTALEELYCGENYLTTLDVSHNTALKELSCYDNELTSLNVSGCTALTFLACGSNHLTDLDVSTNTELESLYCNGNALTTLDVSSHAQLEELLVQNNPSLTVLDCYDCALTSLNVAGCTALTTLICYDNALTSLNVSGCTALEKLSCDGNALTTLDVSGCTSLTELNCYRNALTSLNVSGFTDLTDLNCSGNQLTTLDVSANTALTWLRCSGNQLTTLDVSANVLLTYLFCYDNQLTTLDVSANVLLTYLSCYDNQLTALDISSCTALEWLNCYANQLTSLDISACPSLVDIYLNGTYKETTYNGVTYNKYTLNSSSLCVDKTTAVVTAAPPVISSVKANKTGPAVGEKITWTCTAAGGDGDLKYYFILYKDGTKLKTRSYSSTKTYSYTPTEAGTYKVKVYVKDSAGRKVYKTSKGVTVTAVAAPVITTQPKAQTAAAGATATFKVVASGTGLTYQWQYSKDGTNWTNKTGATSASYTVTAKASYNGLYYRCKVSNAGGSVYSNKAKLTVTSAVSKPEITTQPKAQTAAAGETATFKVVASGTGLTYQWQYSTDYGKTWHDKAGSTKATHTVTVKASYNGYLYRCKVTNSAGTVTSSKVRLTVSGVKPKILSQPAAKTAAAGESVTFKVVAAGVGMTYQWQYKTAGSSTWKDKSGATSASYTVTAKESYNGIQYRCVVTNSIGSVTSDPAVLTVK
ncbi:MAG: leucine-rich repeat domain-containing protein [Oscillospiraceae bacterium]|nr:leucine-rich repeat domain-containing protein [Oscillospiraceae bacterium]